MGDQAEKLRQQVMGCSTGEANRSSRHLIVMLGAQPGIGTTTLAVNMAIAVARRGSPVVLADLNVTHPRLGDSCRLHPQRSLVDLLRGRRQVREILRVGPCGIKVLPCDADFAGTDEAAANVVARLLDALEPLTTTHLVIIDAGSAGVPWIGILGQRATQLVAVTIESPESVMQCYSMIKHISGLGTSARMSLLVNQTSVNAAGLNVQSRLVLSCDRFLNLHLETCGSVPYDERIPQAAIVGRPFIVYAPQSQTAHQMNAAGRWIDASAGPMPGWEQRAA
jgi:flagellar biosynthesis protein FlhG